MNMMLYKKLIRHKKLLLSILLLLIITVIVVVPRDPSNEGDHNNFEYENNSIVGLMPGVDRDAFLAQMQATVDKSAIAFSIDSRPVIEGRRMNISFENPEGNEKDLTIELYDNITGKSIYQSKAIREGSYLSTVTIQEKFEPGERTITAYITAYEIDTHQTIGQSAAELKAVVQ